MQQVNQHVDSAYLRQPPPRPLSLGLLFSLLTDHLLARPFRTILHPLFITGVAVLAMMIVWHVPSTLLALPLGLVVGMLLFGGYRVWKGAWEDIRLMRDGLVLRAHILKLRPNHTLAGEINGALLDCVIPVAPRRTYAGSIWLSDGNEALRLLHQGRLQVLCLPLTPGTWRVIEPITSELSYERVGPSVVIPPDD